MTQTQSSLLTLVIGASAIALVFAVFLARWVLARPRGTPEMQKISNAIQQGADRQDAFLLSVDQMFRRPAGNEPEHLVHYGIPPVPDLIPESLAQLIAFLR